MTIGIDGNEANIDSRVGVGQFAFNVIKTIEARDRKNSYIVYLKRAPLSDMPKERVGWKYRVFGPSKLWTQISLPIKLFTQRERLDLFYSPSHYAPRFSPFPTVISIMDLWHHHHPQQFDKRDLYQLKSWEGYSVKNSSRIITISQFTKSEIIKFYRYPEDKITVAYPGFSLHKEQIRKDKIDEVKAKYGIKGDYLLYLGTLQPKKNIEGLIRAFSIIITNYHSPITLVIAGKKGWLYDEIFNEVKSLGLDERVIFTGFVEDQEKPYLISGAKVFVLPSFYEGFGIPVLEAMVLGVPVALSKEGSLPEVGGKSAFYFDPSMVEDIAGTLEKVIELNKKQRDEIIKAGKIQAQKFTWESCVEHILNTFESI